MYLAVVGRHKRVDLNFVVGDLLQEPKTFQRSHATEAMFVWVRKCDVWYIATSLNSGERRGRGRMNC